MMGPPGQVQAQARRRLVRADRRRRDRLVAGGHRRLRAVTARRAQTCANASTPVSSAETLHSRRGVLPERVDDCTANSESAVLDWPHGHALQRTRSQGYAAPSSTTTLMSSGPRSSASCQRSSGTRRVIRRAEPGAVGRRERRRGRLVVAPVRVDASRTRRRSPARCVRFRLAGVERDRVPARGDAGEADDAVRGGVAHRVEHDLAGAGGLDDRCPARGSTSRDGAGVVARAEVAHQLGLGALDRRGRARARRSRAGARAAPRAGRSARRR